METIERRPITRIELHGRCFRYSEAGGEWRGKFAGIREIIVAGSEGKLLESAETVARWLSRNRQSEVRR